MVQKELFVTNLDPTQAVKKEQKTHKHGSPLYIRSGLIQMENKLPVKARQAFCVMAQKAFPFLGDPNHRMFATSKRGLKEASNFTSANNKRWIEVLDTLMTTKLRFNIFGKDKGGVWEDFPESTTLIAYHGQRVYAGELQTTYEFSTCMRAALQNPEMYLKLNLLITSRLTSKHSLQLYMNGLDFLNVNNNFVEKFFSEPDMRFLLGLTTKYSKATEIHRHIILPAEKEINDTTDVSVTFTPVYSTLHRKKLDGWMMRMRAKPEYMDFYYANKPKSILVPVGQSKQISNGKETRIDTLMELDGFTFTEIDTPTQRLSTEMKTISALPKFNCSFMANPQVKIALEKISFVPHQKAENAFLNAKAEFFGDEVYGYLIYLADMVYEQKERQEKTSKPVRNPGALFVSLLEKGNHISNYKNLLKKQKKEQEKKEQEEAKNKEKRKSQLTAKLKSFFSDYENQRFKETVIKLAKNSPEKLLNRMKSDPHMRRALQMSGDTPESAIENMEKVLQRATVSAHLLNYKDFLEFKSEAFNEELWLNAPEYEKERNRALIELQK